MAWYLVKPRDNLTFTTSKTLIIRRCIWKGTH